MVGNKTIWEQSEKEEIKQLQVNLEARLKHKISNETKFNILKALLEIVQKEIEEEENAICSELQSKTS